MNALTSAESSIMVETYAERLAAAMKHGGLKTQPLADRLGVSYQAIKKALDGKTKSLSAENSSRVAVLTGVNAHWLATGEGEMVPTGAKVETPNVTTLPAPRRTVDTLTELQAIVDNLTPLLRDAGLSVLHKWLDGQASAAEAAAVLEQLQQVSVGSDPAAANRAA